jgi:hypothetical protein
MNIGLVISECKPIAKAHIKYTDDLSYVHSMDLKKSWKLSTDTIWPLPLSYHDRTGHYLPDQAEQICEGYGYEDKPREK